jgi:chromosome segregation ATPase
VVFTPLIDGYINKEISLLDDTVDDLSDNDNEIQSSIKRLIKIKTAVTESLNEQKEFNELVKSKRNSLEIIPFYEAGCNEIIRQTEISDGDMQKIMQNCLFIRDAIKEESNELNDYTKNESKSGLPSPPVFRSIEQKISKLNVYMTLLNGYCYSIQSLSERTQFEHFLSENLINLSMKDKLQLQGMKKMIGQLSNINESVSGLSREVMMLKDSMSDIENTVSSLEYSVDDMRYSVDDIKYDIADSQKNTVN